MAFDGDGAQPVEALAAWPGGRDGGMIPAAIARESALSEPNAAFRGDSDRSWSPKEGIGEIAAGGEAETAIPGRYSDELLVLQPQGFDLPVFPLPSPIMR